MTFLRLEDLTKRFGEFTAVENVDLSIERGEFVSLLGPSGCGKTTTLQMIAGLQEPTAGRIVLGGTDITRLPPNKRGLGIVFQSYALFPHMDATGNVAFGLEMKGIGRSERQERARAALKLVKLDHLADRFPKEMSGGQRQRVALARALVIEPPVLLLDEPLSNLDAKLREEMRIELRLLQQEIGVTTILVTHDQEEALSMSDRVVVMEDGRIAQIAAPLELYERPRDLFVSDFVGKTNLLEARVLSAGERGSVVGIEGHQIDLPGTDLGKLDKVTLSLRPEKLVMSDAADGVEAKVLAAIFLGANWLYRVQTPIGELFVTQPNSGRPGFSNGDKTWLSWPDGAVNIFSAEGRFDETH
ncbi:ABC transporter ATP-binding protein [Tropicimonas sp. IMCC34011]|uniref:ABC transporter ATP-binding protein n=1 Tax=Tropicimonas sp. IMCC34011 TaxID=2248759 RepID=UPI000E226E91|nr:ABC transporter ATP-binding protein [Tropicimonas sp. IMCC34011]